MATWKTINHLRTTREPCIQDRIDQAFRAEWCHLNIFREDSATIVWHFLPPFPFSGFPAEEKLVESGSNLGTNQVDAMGFVLGFHPLFWDVHP